jgi:exopolyphosphatase/pppGpp-phosphohydrolase
MEMKIRQCYSAARIGMADGAPITVLRIGEEQTAVATGTTTQPDAVCVLSIGSKRTAADFFKHAVPTPIELENAIMVVEDEVTRMHAIRAADSTLFTHDAGIREIALSAGVAEQPATNLTLDAVERTFEQLTAVALGRPIASAGIPVTAAFAATLLILREFMHHLQFTSINVTA